MELLRKVEGGVNSLLAEKQDAGADAPSPHNIDRFVAESISQALCIAKTELLAGFENAVEPLKRQIEDLMTCLARENLTPTWDGETPPASSIPSRSMQPSDCHGLQRITRSRAHCESGLCPPLNEAKELVDEGHSPSAKRRLIYDSSDEEGVSITASEYFLEKENLISTRVVREKYRRGNSIELGVLECPPQSLTEKRKVR